MKEIIMMTDEERERLFECDEFGERDLIRLIHVLCDTVKGLAKLKEDYEQ